MRVILAHGLGRSRLSMLWLGRRLARTGLVTEYFSYSSLRENHAAVVARLTNRLLGISASGEEVGLIGHSFGGLLFREALVHVPQLKVKHLIILGTPNQPPRMAAHVYSRLPFRILRRGLAEQLMNRSWYRSLPALTVPYTVVSGTKGWYSRRSPFEFELNDGVVAVSETVLSNADQPVLVPALHSFIMNKRAVFELIVKKLNP